MVDTKGEGDVIDEIGWSDENMDNKADCEAAYAEGGVAWEDIERMLREGAAEEDGVGVGVGKDAEEEGGAVSLKGFHALKAAGFGDGETMSEFPVGSGRKVFHPMDRLRLYTRVCASHCVWNEGPPPLDMERARIIVTKGIIPLLNKFSERTAALDERHLLQYVRSRQR